MVGFLIENVCVCLFGLLVGNEVVFVLEDDGILFFCVLKEGIFDMVVLLIKLVYGG